MRKRLTDRTMKALKPESEGAAPMDVMDTIAPGFGVRVMGTPQHPVRTFILRTRFPGSTNPTRARLGSFDEREGKLSLEAARDKARDWLSMIRKGRDPRLEEERQRQAEVRRQAATFEAICLDFIAQKLPHERRGWECEADLRREFLPVLGKLPAADVDDEHVIKIIRQKARTAPTMARNLFTIINRLYAWAKDQRVYGLKANPCSDIRIDSIVGPKITRNRVLDDSELRALWQAISQLSYPAGPCYRLLLLTGLRLNEAARASWSEFSPTVRQAIRQRGDKPVDWTQYPADQLHWTISGQRMKSQNHAARPHCVPLTVDMLRILESLPQFVSGGDYLFSHNAGRAPARMSGEIKADLDRRMLQVLRDEAQRRGDDHATVEPWRNHDLRRNVRSGLSRLRIPQEIAEAVLAHVRPGINKNYDIHDYYDEKRDALMQWGARLRSIVEPPPANVIALRDAAHG